jgi:hypothetical protein
MMVIADHDILLETDLTSDARIKTPEGRIRPLGPPIDRQGL